MKNRALAAFLKFGDAFWEDVFFMNFRWPKSGAQIRKNATKAAQRVVQMLIGCRPGEMCGGAGGELKGGFTELSTDLERNFAENLERTFEKGVMRN